MLYLIKFIYYTFILPPGLFIIILVLLSFRLYKNQRRIALVLFGVTILFYLSSTSLVGNMMLRPLQNKYRPPVKLSGDVIILLGGGATLDTPNLHGKGHLSGHAANRLLTCLQLYHQLNAPIIVSGGKVYQTTGVESAITRRILLDLGVPDQKILVEDQSRSTFENAQYTKKILTRLDLHKPILVTSAFHLPRAVQQFKKAGVKVIPYPADYQTNISSHFSFRGLIPTAESLSDVSICLKEYLGLLMAILL